MITLHQEIVNILESSKNTMRAAEIAAQVNARGNYKKRDGSEVKSSQISARINKYPEFFEKKAKTILLRKRG